ncbi:MAG: 2-oxo acid dehydrogenase subunit E2, partial [Gammaproteobacteria bacterium]|nr:2-oxo acid dehydrogenase subunit E2 [Gammaproteobacteria bacterium]
LRSWHTVPQVTQFEEADITDLESFRKAQKKTAQAEGYKLTLLAFLIKAVTATLKKYPDFNASLENSGENLIRKNYFNIGIAVETPNGLVVPVVKDADKKGVKEIAIEIISLAEKARNKKLKPAEMQGATFTISSLGGLGGTKFTPIVNWPEVAILGVSRSELRPTYIDDELKPRLWLPLSLSYDHRVVDGAEGARFTRSLSDVLGDIRNLVL